MNSNVFVGTEVKYKIEITSPGFNMYTDDFNIVLKRGSVQKRYEKSDLIHEVVSEDGTDKHNYYLCFDTSEFGAGNIVAIVTAYVPDTDFPDGLRTEIDKFDLLTPKSL